MTCASVVGRRRGDAGPEVVRGDVGSEVVVCGDGDEDDAGEMDLDKVFVKMKMGRHGTGRGGDEMFVEMVDLKWLKF